MESNVTATNLNALAIVNPSLAVDMTKFIGMQSDTPIRVTMQMPMFNVLTVEQMISATSADVIFVDPHVDNFNMNEFISLRQKSNKAILLIGLAYAGADMEMFLGGTFDAVYTLPLSEAIVARMSRELPEKFQEAKNNWKKGAWDSVTPQEIRQVVSQATGNWQKAIIAVWSPKGGVGKTTLAVELAAVLAGIGGRNVCLLDTNLNGGHIRIRLNIMTEYSIVSVASMYSGAMKNNTDWNSSQREINEEMEKYLIPVPGSGNENGKYNFYVIPGITTQEQARSKYLQGQEVVDFMKFLANYLRQRFDFVVIDVGSSVNVPLHRESFNIADTILVVCDPDSAGIADTHKTISKILSNQIPIEKFSLVLNKWKEDVGISIQEVSDLLGITVRGFIPDDHLGGVIKAGNAGQSYVIGNNKKTDNPIATERAMQGFVNVAATFYPPIGAAWAARASSVKKIDNAKFSSSNANVKLPQQGGAKKKKSLFQRLLGG